MSKKILLLFMFAWNCSSDDLVEKLYHNGVIWTGDSVNPDASAILIKGEKIVFIGSDSQAMSIVDDDAIRIDLQGKFVTPGFIDNHVHFIMGGMQLSQVNLYDVTNKEEFQKRILETHAKLPAGKYSWTDWTVTWLLQIVRHLLLLILMTFQWILKGELFKEMITVTPLEY